MALSSGNPQQKQQEEGVILEKQSKAQSDCVKEDGIRKELYELERKAQENWERKWGFLKYSRELWEREAAKLGLPPDILDRNRNKRSLEFKGSLDSYNFTMEKYPTRSSGLIGWRSTAPENNLDRMTGSMYESRKKTMNPPLGPDEPDLKQQRFIFLG